MFFGVLALVLVLVLVLFRVLVLVLELALVFFSSCARFASAPASAYTGWEAGDRPWRTPQPTSLERGCWQSWRRKGHWKG